MKEGLGWMLRKIYLNKNLCRCALAPPDEKMQRAFLECESELGISPQSKMKESCECLKAAGVKIQCP